MGFRFRRSIKVFPGVRLNVGNSGFTSISLGGRGNRLNFSKRGTRHTIGIPGTGLSYSRFITGKSSRSTVTASTAALPAEATEELTTEDLERFGAVPHDIPEGAGRTKWLTLAIGFAGIAASALLDSNQLTSPLLPVISTASLIVVGVGLFLPTRARLKRRELKRCQDLALREKAERIARFRGEASHFTGDPIALNQLFALQHDLKLTEEELGGLELLHATKEVLDWEQALGGKLQLLQGFEAMIRPDQFCYFTTPATYDKRGDDDPHGTLYLTEKRALFISDDSGALIPWSKVTQVTREYRELHLRRQDRQNPSVFWISELSIAMKAEFVAKNLQKSASATELRTK